MRKTTRRRPAGRAALRYWEISHRGLRDDAAGPDRGEAAPEDAQQRQQPEDTTDRAEGQQLPLLLAEALPATAAALSGVLS